MGKAGFSRHESSADSSGSRDLKGQTLEAAALKDDEVSSAVIAIATAGLLCKGVLAS